MMAIEGSISHYYKHISHDYNFRKTLVIDIRHILIKVNTKCWTKCLTSTKVRKERKNAKQNSTARLFNPEFNSKILKGKAVSISHQKRKEKNPVIEYVFQYSNGVTNSLKSTNQQLIIKTSISQKATQNSTFEIKLTYKMYSTLIPTCDIIKTKSIILI